MARGYVALSAILTLGLAGPAYGAPPVKGPKTPTASGQAPVVAAPNAAGDAGRRGQVVVRLGEFTLTVGDIEDRIAEQPALLRARYRDRAELQKLVDNLIRVELLGLEAEKRGYGKSPAVVRTVKDSAVSGLLRTEIDEKITPASITPEEVRAYYEANPTEFQRFEVRRASHILVESEVEAKDLLAQAAKLDTRAFAELAREKSKDLETRLRGGDLGYFSAEPTGAAGEARVHEALRAAAFGLKAVGDLVTQPVKVEGRFSVLRLTGERPAQATSLEEADMPIRTRLWREKRQAASDALVEALRAKDKPVVNADLVDLVKLDDMDKGPAGIERQAPQPRASEAQRAGGE